MLPSTLRKWSSRLFFWAWGIFAAVYALPLGTAWLEERGAFKAPQTQVDTAFAVMISWLVDARNFLATPSVLLPVLVVLFSVSSFAIGTWMHAYLRRKEQDLVDANRSDDIRQLSEKIDQLQSVFDRYVKPRKLSKEQIDAIEQFLLHRPKHKIRIVCDHPNNEANSFAGQISQGFRHANWDVQFVHWKPGDPPIQEGLHLRVRYPTDPESAKSAKSACADVHRSLEAAGVQLDGSGSGSGKLTPEIDIMLAVGHKRRCHSTTEE